MAPVSEENQGALEWAHGGQDRLSWLKVVGL